MHSIERYGAIALIFLVVTVMAVLMWDSDEESPKQESARANQTPPSAARSDAPERGKPAEPARSEPSTGDAIATLSSRPRPLRRDLEPRPVETQPGAQLAAGHERQSNEGATRTAADDGAPAGELATEPLDETAVAELSGGGSGARPLVRPEPRVYVVRDKDTLSEIALRELGSSKRWPEIIDQNPGLNPAKLLVGARLKLPTDDGHAPRITRPADSTAAAAPTRKPATVESDKTYRVRADDSLWRIADRALGNGERWKEILALNPGLDPSKLDVGTELKLPSGAKPAAATSAPRLVAQNTPAAPTGGKKGRVR